MQARGLWPPAADDTPAAAADAGADEGGEDEQPRGRMLSAWQVYVSERTSGVAEADKPTMKQICRDYHRFVDADLRRLQQRAVNANAARMEGADAPLGKRRRQADAARRRSSPPTGSEASSSGLHGPGSSTLSLVGAAGDLPHLEEYKRGMRSASAAAHEADRQDAAMTRAYSCGNVRFGDDNPAGPAAALGECAVSNAAQIVPPAPAGARLPPSGMAEHRYRETAPQHIETHALP